MLSAHNMLNPQDGSPVTLPSQDMVLGFILFKQAKKTKGAQKVLGEGRVFYSAEEVVIAFNEKKIGSSCHYKSKGKM